MAPDDAEKIDSFIKRIEDLLNLNQPFHVVSFASGNLGNVLTTFSSQFTNGPNNLGCLSLESLSGLV